MLVDFDYDLNNRLNFTFPSFYFHLQGTVSEIITHCINVPEVNSLNTSTLDWMREYSTKDDYQMESLSKEQMDKLFHRLELEPVFFSIFYNHYHRSSNSPKWTELCLEECRKKHLSTFKVCDPMLTSC